jgi:acyl dehydratase
MAMNADLVGREYPASTYDVEADAIRAYARACNETDERFLSEDDAAVVAPPLFPVVFHMRAAGKAIGDPELGIDFKRALHGEQDMRFAAPIRPGDRIETTARIEAIEAKQSGETLALALRSTNQDGTVVDETLFTLFVRGPGGPSASASAPPQEHGEPLARLRQQIDEDQTYRYSDASGDRTKIHLDADIARRAGLPGIIGHGLCTMAFTARAVVEAVAGGDPTRLQRLAVRFAKPVRPGQIIETRIWAGAAGGFEFETYAPDGTAVITAGRAVISD